MCIVCSMCNVCNGCDMCSVCSTCSSMRSMCNVCRMCSMCSMQCVQCTAVCNVCSTGQTEKTFSLCQLKELQKQFGSCLPPVGLIMHQVFLYTYPTFFTRHQNPRPTRSDLLIIHEVFPSLATPTEGMPKNFMHKSESWGGWLRRLVCRPLILSYP